MDQAFWDERYRSAAQLWSGEPNPQLVSEISGMPGGTALDVAAGEGADAIWLARHGFQVTAVDISQVALERAQVHARDADEAVVSAIRWVHADLKRWQPEPAYYDLVSIQFLHMHSALRVPIYQRMASAVKPQGTLLIVGHHPSDRHTTVKRPPDPDLLFSPRELADLFDAGWQVQVSEARKRMVHDAEGNLVKVHDTVFKAKRQP